ncbi:MAG: DNA repair protein RecN [Clostridia bacterium]|nr:DNA repair protein RecN [Clostridia bacterium]
MLKSLKIQNVALIERAEISFGEGLNVLSGETGAGKSVIMECVNFALGQKADKTMITSGQESCSVVCVFDALGDRRLKDAFSDLDIDYDEEIVIKRTLTADGKSSIRLNGEAVNATMLKKITSLLVDVHGQSDHFALLKESNQLELIDALGDKTVAPIKRDISQIIAEIKEVVSRLDALGGNAEDRARRIDYLEFCIKEIESVDFKEGEDEQLVSRKKKLINSEKIASAIAEATEKLSGDASAIDLIAQAERAVSQISQFDEAFAGIADELSQAIDGLNDVSARLKDCFDTDFDPKELDLIEERLDRIGAIKSKYGRTYEDVNKKYNDFLSEVELLSESGSNAEKLEKAKGELTACLESLYDKLTVERKKTAEALSLSLSAKLKELAMKNARFSVGFEREEGVLSPLGADKVTFLFSANLGEPPKPLSKVISGGELSRLMLAVKSVTGDAISRSTYVFDEIDSGISGNAARVVAENFAKIAQKRQIIAISHLPQIVAMADRSLLIEKTDDGVRTRTEVVALSDAGHVKEVLRLIGGAISRSGEEHAKEMIALARAYKNGL